VFSNPSRIPVARTPHRPLTVGGSLIACLIAAVLPATAAQAAATSTPPQGATSTSATSQAAPATSTAPQTVSPANTASQAGSSSGAAPQATSSTGASSTSSTSTCPTAAQSQPFSKWGDANFYELVAGGDFEGSLSGWTLSRGAAQVAGSETYGVTGSVGKYSLALPAAGASAQSPFTCVTAGDPTFRFFARNEGPPSSVSVAVAYQTPLGVIAVTVGTVTLNSGWQPSAAMPTGAAIAGALSANGTAQMALRFTALAGSSRIDDVFVDPRMR
jgi:hypothetical protein